VLPELSRSLARAGFHMILRRLEITSNTDVHRVPLPPASVFVIDCQSTGAATEGLIASIRTRRRRARIIALVNDLGDLYTFPLLRLGVKGLIPYDGVSKQLARAVQLVARGGVWIPRTVMSHYLELVQNGQRGHVPFAKSKTLSRREKEVLDLLLKNLSNKEIASTLHISESTVKFHVSKIFGRFGVQRRTDLILQSIQETTTVH
jgi:DNA-binding NarL/FixJ family response regulator